MGREEVGDDPKAFSYLAGFLFIWLVWAASFAVAVGAVAVGSSATWRPGRWKATSTSAS